MTAPHTEDIICLSHLRWDFVYQRPQHLMSRFARTRRVFFVEEPIESPTVDIRIWNAAPNVWVVQPHIPFDDVTARLRAMLEHLQTDYAIRAFILWYYTPMALPWSDDLIPRATVYDCMDELSLFHHAASEMVTRERELLARASLVFTGGHSLYAHKRAHHHDVHAFPSSVEVAHFAQARTPQQEPDDQTNIASPRIGFAGVIDERLDIPFIAALSEQCPDVQIVMLGPVVKIDPATLPRRANIHYLGMKSYNELPQYMAGWGAALVPFARNDATRFISPTKTPEYLAAGLPVLATPIQDVIRPYGEQGLVQIVDDQSDLAGAVAQAFAQKNDPTWHHAVDTFLAPLSWDATHAAMEAEIARVLSPSTVAV